MIYFGYPTSSIKDTPGELALIRKSGFDYAELYMEQPCALPSILMKKRSVVIKELKLFRYPPKAHAPYWADLGGMHDIIREAWIAEGKNIIKVAERLGIKDLTFHSYSFGQCTKERKYVEIIVKNHIETLNVLVKYGKKNGVSILLENTWGPRSISQFRDFKKIVDNVPGLFVTLDIGHAFIVGGINNIRDHMLTFGDKIQHMHFHDNLGKEDDHLSLGKGSIPFERVIAEIRKINYNKTITIENHSDIKNAVADMEFLKRQIDVAQQRHTVR